MAGLHHRLNAQIGRASCRERVETVLDFIFLGSKITADGDCSHEIKKTVTPWKESYNQPR